MDILKTLADNRDTLISLDDGPAALAAMKQLDVEKHLVSKTESNAIEYSKHPTHWIVAMILSRTKHPAPVHRLLCFPKSKFTEKDIAAHLNEYTREILPFAGE